MRVLITGAAGYIGAELIDYFLNDGHQVVAMVKIGVFFDTSDRKFCSAIGQDYFFFVVFEVGDNGMALAFADFKDVFACTSGELVNTV